MAVILATGRVSWQIQALGVLLDGSSDNAGPAGRVEHRAVSGDARGKGNPNGKGQTKPAIAAADRTAAEVGPPRSDAPSNSGSGNKKQPQNHSVQHVARNRHHASRPKRNASHRRTANRRNDGPTYAALDLGTNNCRLLVARPSRRSFLVVDAFSRIIRLGEGVARTGSLSEAAMSRTISALKVCADKMIRRDVQRSRLIATAACRMANNGEEFLNRVREESGMSLEIVDRETEAKLAVSGCASLLDQQCDWALVFDIGGGSSELIWLDLRKRRLRSRRTIHDRIDAQECIVAWTSLSVGVVTLAERFGGQFVTSGIYEDMVRYVSTLLVGFEAEHRLLERTAGANMHFLGTSGTVTTVAGIHMELPRYDRRKVDGCWLTTDEIRCVIEELAHMDYAGRVAQPCIGKDRADLVLAGCAILDAMMRLWPCERLRVADRGLREGILATLMAEDGLYRGQKRRQRK